MGSDKGRLSPPTPVNNYVALSKSLNIFELQGPYLQNEKNKNFLARFFSNLMKVHVSPTTQGLAQKRFLIIDDY